MWSWSDHFLQWGAVNVITHRNVVKQNRNRGTHMSLLRSRLHCGDNLSRVCEAVLIDRGELVQLVVLISSVGVNNFAVHVKILALRHLHVFS